ncbi:hypothetical protein DW1_2292 [Proteiniborus sp. DW1]|uniref:hypothetical protein n=1 Tax=Proteiniborus sp. DW1 TaxID=1889883 RepID=UPI00092E0825|nr:hypothetical protein [Proteiniborus sp. DW1]SCG83856.1 hypothetical protein DW1_2292 [Proteiniborus sp. DW1]
MKKNKLTKFLVVCIILVCLSITVSAESATVYLRADQSSAISGVIGLSKSVDYYAANSPNSLFDVYAIVHRSFPGKGWYKVKESLMDAGTSSSGRLSEKEEASWKLQLNPWGWGFIGCEAVGEIKY